jgi:hypothetical protein
VLVDAGVFEALGVEPAPDDGGDGSLGGAGSWSVSEAIELVCAPPVLCATPVGAPVVASESADDELPSSVVVVDGEVDADDELEGGPDGLFLSVDEEADEVDESETDGRESVGSATAIPGMVATAEPTPSAIANAPTRPTYLT